MPQNIQQWLSLSGCIVLAFVIYRGALNILCQLTNWAVRRVETMKYGVADKELRIREQFNNLFCLLSLDRSAELRDEPEVCRLCLERTQLFVSHETCCATCWFRNF